MKSIKTNPNSAKAPDKGKIENKLYCILLTTLELAWLYFFRKKTDMKFTILVANLKEISPSVFSWKKKEYVYKKLQCNSVKIRFSRKKILNYAYVLKNGVGRYNIFFLFFSQSLLNPPVVSFSCRIRQYFYLWHVLFSANNFTHVQALYRMRSLCRSYECMNIMQVNIECFTGCKRIKQRRISFVPGYLRMILWKISDSLYAFNITRTITNKTNEKKCTYPTFLLMLTCFISLHSTLCTRFGGLGMQQLRRYLVDGSLL